MGAGPFFAGASLAGFFETSLETGFLEGIRFSVECIQVHEKFSIYRAANHEATRDR